MEKKTTKQTQTNTSNSVVCGSNSFADVNRLLELARNKQMFKGVNLKTGETFFGQVVSLTEKNVMVLTPMRVRDGGNRLRRIPYENFAFRK